MGSDERNIGCAVTNIPEEAEGTSTGDPVAGDRALAGHTSHYLDIHAQQVRDHRSVENGWIVRCLGHMHSLALPQL